MRPILQFIRVSAGALALAATLVTLSLAAPAGRSQAGRIETIVPASGRAGDRVTITGIGFGSVNVRITVSGIPAEIVTASGSTITFVVPGGAAAGPTIVSATNPGGLVGSIGFDVLQGSQLQGHPNAPAIDAIVDRPPVGVDPGEIEAGVIMTRLDVRLAPSATVGEVNAALGQVGGEIASMARGVLAMTIAVPRQPSIETLKALVETLESAPGIGSVSLAVTSAEDQLPSVNAATIDHQLLPTRFPAAWNARSLVIDPATGQCRQPLVPVLVADKFVSPAPLVHDIGFSFLTFSHEIPNFTSSPPGESLDSTHGYDVTLMLGAAFNPESKTGANPFSQCLDISAVLLGSLSAFQEVDRLVQNFPTGKFILNYSRSWGKVCADAAAPPSTGTLVVPCEPRHFGAVIPNAIQRADDTLYWKQRTVGRWPDFLVTTSAGNTRDDEPAALYPVLGTAAFNSYINAATLADPMLGFAADTTLWQSPIAGFASLEATSTQSFRLTNDVLALGLDQVGGANNVVRVGSTTQGAALADLVESEFSNSGADVTAVGEEVLTHELTAVNGTSFSAPQVAGLASYLWLLSPTLRAEEASATRRAIIENTRTTALAGAVIDAYATVLSLDAAISPSASTAPIRLAILDVDDDGEFDEDDLTAFRAAYVDPGSGGQVEPTTPDYGRFDLNGDGFTGGSSRRERFDLDRVGSTRFGPSDHAVVTLPIENQEARFDETALTDLEILCYYAYSAMYDKSPDTRKQLLGDRCVLSITPATATLAAGQTLQFTANSPSGAAVTWTATGGTVSGSGLFTAGAVSGTFVVTATSAGAVAEATVVIAPGGGSPTLGGTLTFNGSRELLSDAASQQETATTTVSFAVPLALDSLGREVIQSGSGPAAGPATATRRLQVFGCLDEHDTLDNAAVVRFSNSSVSGFSTQDLVITVFVSGTDNRVYSWTEPAFCDSSGTRPSSSTRTITQSSSPYGLEFQLRGTVRRSADDKTIIGVDFDRNATTVSGTSPVETLTIVTTGRLDAVR